MPLGYDPPHFSVHQKGPVSIDCQTETHQYALVMDEIIGMSWKSFAPQIRRRGAHDPPAVGEALDAQRAVRQFAIPDGEILSLPYQIDITIRQVEIDGHFRVLGQERIEDWNNVAAAQVDRRAELDRS